MCNTAVTFPEFLANGRVQGKCSDSQLRIQEPEWLPRVAELVAGTLICWFTEEYETHSTEYRPIIIVAYLVPSARRLGLESKGVVSD